MHEYSRQQGALQQNLQKAVSATFREIAPEVADTDMANFLASSDNARRFDLICEDLTPGGTDAYVFYRALSRLSHAGIPVVELYFAKPPAGTVIPPARPHPRTPLGPDFILFLTNASMVWSGRAVNYMTKERGYRGVLRDAARDLEITSELQLSDAYRKRHATARRGARENTLKLATP